MHESSVTRALIEQVGRLIDSQPGGQLRSIRVQVGEFSGVDADLLQEAYDRETNGTPLHSVRLELRRVPLEAGCPACAREFPVSAFRFVCPACGSRDVVIRRGEELLLESLTFEEAGPS